VVSQRFRSSSYSVLLPSGILDALGSAKNLDTHDVPVLGFAVLVVAQRDSDTLKPIQRRPAVLEYGLTD
jgi:hypothetical protein